jgi:polysaccharide biosynthesis/export protein
MKHIRLISVCLFLLALAWTAAAPAQVAPLQEQGRAAQYFLGSQDQVLMAVNIWGFVNKPGQYMVPYETDLISLLSYAGGPREEAKIHKIRLVRSKADKPQVIEIDVKKFLSSGKASDIPVLRPGDTVVVFGTSFHFINKFFDFTVRLAALVQVWVLVDYYTRH